MASRFVLSSSARISTISFDSVESAVAFLESRKLSEEKVCLTDALTNRVVFERNYH